jgi:hypothetical protein
MRYCPECSPAGEVADQPHLQEHRHAGFGSRGVGANLSIISSARPDRLTCGYAEDACSGVVSV